VGRIRGWIGGNGYREGIGEDKTEMELGEKIWGKLEKLSSGFDAVLQHTRSFDMLWFGPFEHMPCHEQH
jgi:hypothetical protein